MLVIMELYLINLQVLAQRDIVKDIILKFQ